MTLSIVLEDGTKVSNANSYVTVSDVNNYSALMNLTDVWDTASSPTDQEVIQAVLIACRSLEQNFGPRYISAILPPFNQALLWPRYIVWNRNNKLVNQNTIPQELKDAQCQLAIDYVANGSDINYLFPPPNTDANVLDKNVKVGDINVSTRYSRSTFIPNFVVVEKILWPIVRDPNYGSFQVSL